VATGVDVTINEVSSNPVTVDITTNGEAITKQMSTMVDQFNKLRDKLSELTAFDPAKYTSGLLFGSTEALRVDLAFGQLFSGKTGGAGTIRSIAELGISFNDKGKLEFNRQRFQAVMDRDPAAVKEFFTNTEKGFATKAKTVADSLSGTKGGALLQRSQTLQAKIDINAKRIESINRRLDAERTRLLNQFYNMETAIAKIQTNLNSISKIAPLST
jgi:flagellar hook-associated protein 2